MFSAKIQRCGILSGWISLYDVILQTGTYFLDLYQILLMLESLVAPRELPASPSDTGLMATRGTFLGLLDDVRKPSTVEALLKEFDRLERDATKLNLKRTKSRIKYARKYLESVTVRTIVDFSGDARTQHEIRTLHESLIEDLSERWIFFPDLEKFDKYFYNLVERFPKEIREAFPDAKEDIADAGHCYVTDNNTACVFHCMRVAEYGLRGLALHLDPTYKPEKLEWGPIIRDLDQRIGKMHEQNQQPDPDREAKLDFYKEAVGQCRFFKKWRDDVSHTRGHYEVTEALRALTRVEEFMRALTKNGVKLPASPPV